MHLSIIVPLIFLLPLFSPAAATAYDVLRRHGLPIGLLPKGIQNFSIDPDGRFQASLPSPCTAKFESEMRYNASVTGVITDGQIAGLSGVAAQDLFLWFPVRAIRLDNDTSGIIHFDVGVVDKRYPKSLFDVPPECSPVGEEAVALREGENIAGMVAESQLGKLRYELDQDDLQRADI